jgi:DNA-binding NarL/FixJ family response regulator
MEHPALQLAELAAAGRPNREIAEALLVTTAAVEYHLRNACRKLVVGSWRQLAERCASRGRPAATQGAAPGTLRS